MEIIRYKIFFFTTIFLCFLGMAEGAFADTHYVSKSGSDSGNNCANQNSPCLTITQGISQLSGGDTLIIGDGVYAEAIRNIPSGSAGAYTTVQAENNWGVLIDGSGGGLPSAPILISGRSYIAIRGIKTKMSQSSASGCISVLASDHIKLIRCSASYSGTGNNAPDANVSSIVIGTRGGGNSDILLEECYSYGGGRYQFNISNSNNVIVRRCVARHDFWDSGNSLQCAGFTNYDSKNTTWQNNIVLDSDGQYCEDKLYGGWWNENKDEQGNEDTSQAYYGNIALNVTALGINDIKVSGNHAFDNNVIWGCVGGYGGGAVPSYTYTTPPSWSMNNLTIGDSTGIFNNNYYFRGIGAGIDNSVEAPKTIKNSIIYGNNSYGLTEYIATDYNVMYGNGANFGGRFATPTAGTHDRCSQNGNAISPTTNGLVYLPRIESNSALKTAGENGAQIGAEVVYRMGVGGTLYGETGWNTLTSESLWPFPNEDIIKADMAGYNGFGPAGARGFAAPGNGLYGGPITLTSYIWEYLGNPCPGEICGGGGGDATSPASPSGLSVR